MRWFGLCLVCLLTGCLPIPQVRLNPDADPVAYRLSPDGIRRDYRVLAGYAEPSTPEAYNRSMYMRYHAMGDRADTILVIMPGIFGGATSVDILARQLVASTANLEVWAVDRRANALEDRQAMIQSLKTHNPQIAYDFYITNFGKPEGFNLVSPDDVRFMSEWGLKTHLYDLHEIIKEARRYASRVILGGHSLGASIVSYYAAFEFPDGTGYTFLDGLCLIDGVLGRTGGFDREPQGLNLGPLELIPGTEALKENRGSPYLTFGLSPEFHAKREVAALFAHFKPTELSTGDWFDFPVTNRAVVGIRDDDQYGASTAFSSSLGRVVGATLAGNITAVILGGAEGVYSQSVTGVARGFNYVDWERGDSRDEASNLDEVVKVWSLTQTNRSEWYFPLRLALDLGQFDVRLENTPGFVPNRLVTTPTLAVGAKRGLVTSLDAFSAYSNARVGSPFSAYIIPDFTHLDIVQAEENPLVIFFQRWLEQLPE